ncbi:sensor histidine kinase [Halomonas faecis]|uniref:sensor histidine kinase n=1 Tax=Halomonas faecis TaxID=1562110 RepID=UPI0013D819F0|nr:ATP-binding protein [Halomonas faecis]
MSRHNDGRSEGNEQPYGDCPSAMPHQVEAEEWTENAWMEVIQRMDEVYRELLDNETALEEKNRELEQSQSFMLSVLAAMSDILLVCDRRGHISQVNRAFMDLVGMTERELIGQPLSAMLGDEASRARLCQPTRFRRAHDEPIHDCEVSFCSPSSPDPRPVAVNCSPLLDASRRVTGMVIVGRPVGELRQAYQALNDAHQSLKRTQQQLVQSEKLASLGQLVAGVAHELNNPIGFVLGNVFALRRYTERIMCYLEAVHRQAPLDELHRLRTELRIDHLLADLPSLVEGTVEGAERTQDIVDALKRFSASDERLDQFVDLSQVVARSLHWVERATPRRLDMSNDLPETLVVHGSESQLQQVVINLLNNALDAMQESPQPRLCISGEVQDGLVTVRFHDDGPGVDPSVMGRIFDPFFTTKPVGSGTGLGLSVSYGIVDRHGGRLEVDNHPQGGAVFRLTLPAARSEGP